MRIYLDSCCLNRPYDDFSIRRNAEESAAVLDIIELIRQGVHEGVSSPVNSDEIDQMTNSDRQASVRAIMRFLSCPAVVNQRVADRAKELSRWGFKPYDALHTACAEGVGADILLTVDGGMLKAAARAGNRLKVKIANPLDFAASTGASDADDSESG